MAANPITYSPFFFFVALFSSVLKIHCKLMWFSLIPSKHIQPDGETHILQIMFLSRLLWIALSTEHRRRRQRGMNVWCDNMLHAIFYVFCWLADYILCIHHTYNPCLWSMYNMTTCMHHDRDERWNSDVKTTINLFIYDFYITISATIMVREFSVVFAQFRSIDDENE